MKWVTRARKARGSARCKVSRLATRSTARSAKACAKARACCLAAKALLAATTYPDLFGPVAAIIAADDERDAIRIANASEFGLGSGVLTADLNRGRRIAAEELEAGSSFVNENVRSDPRTPFGGIKHSGYGRECSAYGIREFTNIKTVWIQ